MTNEERVLLVEALGYLGTARSRLKGVVDVLLLTAEGSDLCTNARYGEACVREAQVLLKQLELSTRPVQKQGA